MNILAKIAPKVNSVDPCVELANFFKRHHAPQSVPVLYELWVERADESDNGIIMVNRHRQPYSVATVDRAIKWLKAHGRLLLIERGGGRGNGSRYFIRWSFTHETLSARQNAVNHPEHAKTLSFDTFARVGALRALKEKLQSKKHSSYKYETFTNVVLSASKKTIITAKNKKMRRLRNERAVRWAMAQIRAATADKNVLAASARSIRSALASGRVFIGAEVGRFVQELTSWIQDHEETGWEEWPQPTFSYIGFAAQDAISTIRYERMKWAERQARSIEREEARRDPIGSFSCRDYNKRNLGGDYATQGVAITASGEGRDQADAQRGVGTGPDSDRVESSQAASHLFSKSLEWREP